ncbi:replication protein A 70 kDa DNA-binding subunit B-like [Rutidosis leptorrhynchoides]|uniref:replication protein A 70 kDa DNA-binding subunit B-like n=1 Tax=Rutidosis leptorrhynchoides TaxID=125765 RepID=UPI003A99FE90
MAVAIQYPSVQSNQRSYSYLNELQVGQEAEVRIMICRTWDTHTKYGKYLSTEFISSDEQGNVIQLTARSTVAHCFISRLKEGTVYSLNKFEVIPNKDDYRLLRDNKVLIQLQGSTFLRRISGSAQEGFVRHPFACVPFEELQPNGGQFLIDVVGCVVNVGSVTPQKSGSSTLEFELVNESHRRVRVTLWGKLGDSFLAMRTDAPAQYSIILSSVATRKDYYGTDFYSPLMHSRFHIPPPPPNRSPPLSAGGTSLSSMSATLIIDDTQIPTLDEFINKISGMQFPDVTGDLAPQGQFPAPIEGSIADLLGLARRGKNNVADVFKCKVELTNIRMKNSWYYNSCSICEAKKSISRQYGGFWCESCDKNDPEPIARFRIQFDVRDSTGETVVVLFDETAEPLTGTTAKALLAGQDAATCTTVLPNALANLLTTSQVLLLKINSYYEHGTYESFNCIKVYLDEKPHASVLAKSVEPATFYPAAKGGAASTLPSSTTPKGVKRSIEISTPTKALERPSRRKFVVTTSDSEDDPPAGAVNETDKAGLSQFKRTFSFIGFPVWPYDMARKNNLIVLVFE